MKFGIYDEDRDELLGSYEQEMKLKGTAEDFTRVTVYEIQKNWAKYKSYIVGKFYMNSGDADELLALTTLDLAKEENIEDSVYESYKALESHIKSMIDTVNSRESNSVTSSLRGVKSKEEALEKEYKGYDNDSTYDLSDRQQIQKWDGLDNSLINVQSELEEIKPYRYLSQGVDMLKVIYLMLSADENNWEDENLKVLDMLQVVLGYDNEAMEAIRIKFTEDTKFIDLWKSLFVSQDGLSVLKAHIGGSAYYDLVFD